VTASTLPVRPLPPSAYVLTGGLVAGGLDIGYAWLFWGVKAGLGAQRIFQSVAAGLLGKASFAGGWPTALLGLGLHFCIATSMSLTYYLLARRRPLLREHPLACGAGYGLILYAIMNFVVVPLSAAPGGSKDPLWVALSVAVHVLFIGIPIALFTRLALQQERPRTA